MENSEHPKKEIEHTLVIKSAEEPPKGKSTGTDSSRLLGDAPKSIDPVNLEADSSMDFRRSLEISDKRYKIQKMIGEGGFGRIFLAKDLVLGREVVIKSLKENQLVRDESGGSSSLRRSSTPSSTILPSSPSTALTRTQATAFISPCASSTASR